MDFTAMTSLPLDTTLTDLVGVVDTFRSSSSAVANWDNVKVSLTPDTQRIHFVAHWSDGHTH